MRKGTFNKIIRVGNFLKFYNTTPKLVVRLVVFFCDQIRLFSYNILGEEFMNYKIVVDAGHGGADPGAVSGLLKEKDFTLRAAKYMYNRFKQLGIPVYITRDTDETLSKAERVKRILNAFGNRDDVILISNHINAGGGDGAEVIYALRNKETLAKSVLNNIAKQGQNIRSFYQRRLPSDPSKDYYFIHRETGKLEPILVEYGFIDSPKDDVGQLQNNIDKYAEAVVQAVLDYIGVSEGVNTTYVVQKGDTLWSIANKYSVPVDQLMKANNLGTTLLTVGQTLVIPKSNIDGNNDNNDNNGNNDSVYVVKPGDTLWNIARKNNISVDELKRLNNLTNNMLSIGQKLILPSGGKTYVVQKGDSLWKIANLYNVNVEDLIKFNNLDSNTLQIGQKLLIP